MQNAITVACLVTLFLSASAWAGCRADTECKGDRICVDGKCVDPPPRAEPPPPPPPPPRQTGIGAQLVRDSHARPVLRAYGSSASQRAGIRPTDVVVSIDGTPMSQMSQNAAAARLIGPAGSVVVLELNRDGEVIRIQVVRE